DQSVLCLQSVGDTGHEGVGAVKVLCEEQEYIGPRLTIEVAQSLHEQRHIAVRARHQQQQIVTLLEERPEESEQLLIELLHNRVLALFGRAPSPCPTHPVV